MRKIKKNSITTYFNISARGVDWNMYSTWGIIFFDYFEYIIKIHEKFANSPIIQSFQVWFTNQISKPLEIEDKNKINFSY